MLSISSSESIGSSHEAMSPYSKRYPLISGSSRITKERRDLERERTELIHREAELSREQAKADMFLQRIEKKNMASAYRQEDSYRWEERHAKSPFRVNLLAEEERIHEEHFIKEKEKKIRKRTVEAKIERAKSDIVNKALTEFSDLEALRKEKRAILDEEHRLRALLALEKTSNTRKSDREAAKRALKQRYFAKGEYRRQEFRSVLDQAMEEEAQAYRKKHNLPSLAPLPTGSYSS